MYRHLLLATPWRRTCPLRRTSAVLPSFCGAYGVGPATPVGGCALRGFFPQGTLLISRPADRLYYDTSDLTNVCLMGSFQSPRLSLIHESACSVSGNWNIFCFHPLTHPAVLTTIPSSCCPFIRLPIQVSVYSFIQFYSHPAVEHNKRRLWHAVMQCLTAFKSRLQVFLFWLIRSGEWFFVSILPRTKCQHWILNLITSFSKFIIFFTTYQSEYVWKSWSPRSYN